MKEQEMMNLPEGYKMTELGPLPEEWEVVRLGEVAKLIRGISWGKKDEDPNGTPVIAIPNVHNGRISFDIRYKITKSISDSKKLNEGDILLVGSSGSVHNVGRTAVVEGLPFKEATFASFLIKAISVSTIDKQYLFYLFQSPIVDFPSCSKRAADGKYNLQLKQLSEHSIPLPPLPEQKKIAAVLSVVQEAKEKTEEIIKATKELKKSLMKYLFTYGPVPVEEAEKVKLKETEIGMIPENWEVVDFEKCIIKKKLKVGKVKKQQYKKFGKFPIVDQGKNLIAGYWENEKDVYQGELPVIIFGDHTRIIKFIDFPFVAGADGTKVLIPNISIIYPRFFYYTLLTLKIPSRGYNRHYSLLREKKIPLPPLPTQQKIASILSSVDEKIQAEEDKKKALEDLFKTLLHDLMTAKIRVNHIEVEA